MIRGKKILLFPRLTLAVIALLVAATETALSASVPENRPRSLSLSAGALDESLKSFSDQTGISVIYDHRIVRGQSAPAIAGKHRPRDALSTLLKGSSLEYLEIDDRTLAIIRQQPIVEAIPSVPALDLLSSSPRQRVDEIIVTASYRAPSIHAGVRIDYALDKEVLELSGSQNVAEPIHDLPATVASVSSANTQLQISAGGLNLADLRGFGPERSLVLVNGRRFVRTNGGNGIYGVDLNNFSTAFIDRVEVIHQGAGPVLGTDAVAGAINIVLRDHIDGISLSADGGVSERGDAGEYSVSVYAGSGFADARGKVSGGVSFASDPSLFFTDRDYLSEPYGFGMDGRRTPAGVGFFAPGFGGSTLTPAGNVAGIIEAGGRVVPFFDTADVFVLSPGGFERFEGRPDQTYNWLTGFSALPEIERLHGFAKSSFEISSTLSVFGEFLFADTETISQVAPAPISVVRGASPLYGDAIVVPADHPDAPTGLRSALETQVGGPIESFLIQRRFVELGPRRREIGRQSFQFVTGLRAQLSSDWRLDAEYQFGRNKTDDTSTGIADGSLVATAADPTLCASDPDCVPLNVFAGESVSRATADYYRIPARRRRLTTSEHIVRLALAGALYRLDEREARLDVGLEYRRDKITDGPPPNHVDRLALAEFEIAGSDGAVDYTELFGVVDLPVTPPGSWLGAFDFGADFRLTRWSGGGLIANFAGDVSWRPTGGVELYAYALRGGRAPNVIELFSNGPNVAYAFADPCAIVFSAIVTENCSTPGPLSTPAGFTQATPLIRVESTGNPRLDAENVHSRHFGVAVDFQEFINLGGDALRITADWRFNRIDNAISFADQTDALFDCYESVNLSSRFCGVNPATGNPFIRRDPSSGALLPLEATFLNNGVITNSGLDATLAYRSELAWAPFGPSLSVDVLYSYTNKATRRGFFDDKPIDQTGLANFPRHQVYSTASLETERFKTQWTIRRRGAAETVAGLDIPEARLPPTTYVDAGFQFRPSNAVIVYAGVENLFDKDLPIAAFAEGGFLAAFYDPIGRRYFAGAKVEF